MLCSGKHYYALLKEREASAANQNIAIVRIEELCPFPLEALQQELKKYPSAKGNVILHWPLLSTLQNPFNIIFINKYLASIKRIIGEYWVSTLWYHIIFVLLFFLILTLFSNFYFSKHNIFVDAFAPAVCLLRSGCCTATLWVNQCLLMITLTHLQIKFNTFCVHSCEHFSVALPCCDCVPSCMTRRMPMMKHRSRHTVNTNMV